MIIAGITVFKSLAQYHDGMNTIHSLITDSRTCYAYLDTTHKAFHKTFYGAHFFKNKYIKCAAHEPYTLFKIIAKAFFLHMYH